MKTLFLVLTLLLISGCGFKSQEQFSKRVKINGLICPVGYSTHQVKKDLSQCQYYDEKAAAEASKSPLKPECIKCLQNRGYEIE